MPASTGWDSDGFALPVNGTDLPDTVLTALVTGMNAVAADYSGTADPSSGEGWDADQLGRRWIDTSGSDENPSWKRWEKFDTGASDYDWRPLRIPVVHDEDGDPASLTLPFAANPTTVNEAWQDFTFLTEIRALQDAVFQEVTPKAVWLEVTATEAGTVGAANALVAFRVKGSADATGIVVKCQVSTIPVVSLIRIPCDSTGTIQIRAVVGTGSPSLAVTVRLRAVEEKLA